MKREEHLQRLRARIGPYDVLIVGGGATGLSAALDAASRGHSTLLLERHDFAKGTSSRSTKLVHGGVRYLRQGNLSLVREALRERARLARNAPHLVHALDFIIPARRWWQVPFYGIGLKLYDALAGRLGMAPSRWLSAARVGELLPGIRRGNVVGGVLYQDGQFDDSRLAIALTRTAAAQGATVLNYVRCDGLLKTGGRVTGVSATEIESGQTHEIAARCVINATGVFVDELRGKDDLNMPPLLSLSQGIHLVLPAEFLPGNRALMVPETDDGRVFFALPWHGRVIMGTTDTPVAETSMEPQAREDEIAFLLEHAARFLARVPTRADVLSVFTGLRPLVRRGASRSTAALSRDHCIEVAKSGLITITGGKWTTCRKMGEDVVNVAEKNAGLPARPCLTAGLALQGCTTDGDPAENLRVYGSDATHIRSLMEAEPDLAQPLHERLPYQRAEVIWQVRHEMARTVEDVLARRTRALFLDARAGIEAADAVAELLGRELGWSETQRKDSAGAFREMAANYILSTQPPSMMLSPSP
jgi:glycerol-3-phosphate dehydrogenase